MPKWKQRLVRIPDPSWLGRLRDSLFYDDFTGALRWLKDFEELGIFFGDYAGSFDRDGYVKVTFEGKVYLAHRLAFVFQTGRWPKNYVDHIDRSRANNSWENLRDVTALQNSRNRTLRSPHDHSTTTRLSPRP